MDSTRHAGFISFGYYAGIGEARMSVLEYHTELRTLTEWYVMDSGLTEAKAKRKASEDIKLMVVTELYSNYYKSIGR